jgi:hypothetical protein
MAVRLGELLIYNKLLTKEQLEEALQAQVIFGGKLGTILIEMGLISENILAGALSKLLKMPCAKPGELQKVPENVIRIISPELAQKYQVVPMAVNGRNLTLAMPNPHDLKAIDDIAFRTGYIIRPILGLEVRLVFALERYYGIKRPTRYIAPPKQTREELDRPVEPLEEALDSEEEYLGEPGSEQIYDAKTTPAPVATEPLEEENIEELEEEDVSLDETSQALIEIRNRDDVADAAIRYLAGHFKRAVLFMVVGGQITGWRSAHNGQPISGLDESQLPVTEPTILKTVIDSQSFFLGPVPAQGANLTLISLLGEPAPTTILILPLVMMGRVVGLICVDDPDVALAEALSELQFLSSKILMAFELLILHNKILRT